MAVDALPSETPEEGDSPVVWKLDRPGRDLRQLIHTVHDLTGRGVGIKVLTPRPRLANRSSVSFAALAEFEREPMSERTVAGLASARARGRRGGRPFTMTTAKLRLVMAAMEKPQTKVSRLCEELGHHPTDTLPSSVAQRRVEAGW